ncbi:hypothetical protein J6590_065387 [Homalodisca vitripennis]|nr:hypothetical protein J6590_065387 [Homalodisca vitripennis]
MLLHISRNNAQSSGYPTRLMLAPALFIKPFTPTLHFPLNCLLFAENIRPSLGQEEAEIGHEATSTEAYVETDKTETLPYLQVFHHDLQMTDVEEWLDKGDATAI